MTEPLSLFSRAIQKEIARRRGTAKRGTPTQEQIAEAIGRTQPYVSERLRGLMPWTADDIDGLAPLFGMTSFELIAAAGVGGSSEDDYSFDAEGPGKAAHDLAAKQGTRKIDE